MTQNMNLGFGTSPNALSMSIASRSMDKRERCGSEKNQQDKN